MSKRFNIIRSVGAVALLMQCATVNALFTTPETEAFTLSTNPGFQFTQTNVPPTVIRTGTNTDFQDLTFDKFDTGLGNLLGVRVTYATSYGAAVTLNVTSFAEEPRVPAVTYFADGSFSLSLTGSGLNQSLSPTLGVSCTPNPPSTGTSCSASGSVGPNAFNSASPIGLTPLSSFFGPGTFILTATLASAINPRISPDNSTVGSFADNSTMAGTLSDNWAGNVTVQYEYEQRAPSAVPEPYTLYLLLAGVGAIALLRRRRA